MIVPAGPKYFPAALSAVIDHKCCSNSGSCQGIQTVIYTHTRAAGTKRASGEMSRASTTPFQNLFKCHPWKTDVGNQPHVCAHNLLSVSVTCVRGVWEAKCENWELTKETVTVAFGKAQGTLWVSLQKIKHRCVYSPWLPTWKQLWNKEGNFALCWFLSSLKTKLELNAVSPLAFLLVFCVQIGGLVSPFDS